MFRKIALLSCLSFIGISLTGCIVAPYDDYPDRYDQRHEHRHDSDGRWDRHDRNRWEHKRDNDRHDWDKERRDRRD